MFEDKWKTPGRKIGVNSSAQIIAAEKRAEETGKKQLPHPGGEMRQSEIQARRESGLGLRRRRSLFLWSSFGLFFWLLFRLLFRSFLRLFLGGGLRLDRDKLDFEDQ